MKNLLFSILIVGSVFSQCNETNWQEFYPYMQNCQLSGADLSYASLSGAILVNADLSEANLSFALCDGADLSDANLTCADLYYTDFYNADFYLANLNGADLYGAYLYGTSFTDANLACTNLYQADLYSADLTGACLQGALGFMQTDYLGAPVIDGCFECSMNPPIAQESTYTLDEDMAITLALEAYDEDGDALSYMIVSAPTFGTTTLSGNVVTYIPNANFNGTDSFQFIANDGQYDSNTATVTLVVNAVNDAPYLYSVDNSTIILGETFTYTLQAEDADGDNLIYTVSVSGGSANANISGNTLTVEPQEANVTLNVVVTVTDGNTTHSIAFLITVLQPQQTCLDNNHDGWCDQFPTMSINGDTVLLLGLEPGGEYTDDGAACSDSEEGNISNQVEVSGQVVNLSTPDTYEIYYNCSDSDGNTAQTLTRTVVVMPDFISDENQDGFDDDAFMAGAQSGDANMDGSLDVVDIVIFINSILNGE